MPIKSPLLDQLLRSLRSSPRAVVIALELLIGLGICLASLLIFIHFSSEVLEKETLQLDITIARAIYTLRTPPLTTIMILISDLGENVTLVAAGAIGLFLLIKKHQKELVLFSMTMLMGLALNMMLKNVIHRPRPELSPLVVETSFSFPSGHAMNSFLFYSLLAYFSYHFWHSKKLSVVVGVVSGATILLIGFSRIYLGVHYPSDVLAGYIAGFWWLVTVLIVERTLVFYKLFKESA